MAWNATYPDGAQSVAANVTIGQQNTTYTENTLNVDHYWDTGVDEDGHHRFVQMPNGDLGSSSPTMENGMNGVLYTAEIQGTSELIWKNLNYSGGPPAVNQSITQVTPVYLTGEVALSSTSSFANVVTVPLDCYGEIFLYSIGENAALNFCHGYWQSHNSRVRAYSDVLLFASSGTAIALANADGDTPDLNIRAKLTSGPSATYTYQVKCWKTNFPSGA